MGKKQEKKTSRQSPWLLGRLVGTLLCAWLALPSVAQHQLDSVFVMVKLMDNGDAHVTERRDAHMGEEGTEGFITFNNMGDIEVTDLKVWDEEETEYVVEDHWNVERSREQKAGRCGYHRTSQGVEICWGIGKAGKRSYYIQYTLTHLVKSYEDYDGFCHSFYEAANSPAAFAMVAVSFNVDSLTKKDARIWTFGYDGWKGHTRNYVWARTEESSPMRNGDAIIMLLEIEKGLLHPAVKKEGTFKELVKRPAFVDSEYDIKVAMGDTLDKRIATSSLMGGNIGTGHENGRRSHAYSSDDSGGFNGMLIFGFLLVAGIILFAVGRKMKEDWETGKFYEVQFKRLADKMGGEKWDDLPYWRDLPMGGNLLGSGIVLRSVSDIMRNAKKSYPGFVKFTPQHLYEALVLRIFYKGGITFDTDVDKNGNTRKLFRINPPKSAPQEQGPNQLEHVDTYNVLSSVKRRNKMKKQYMNRLNDDGMEHTLHELLLAAAGSDHLLQPDELKDYVEGHMKQLGPLADALYLFAEGTVGDRHLKVKDVQQVMGFLHYLKDFSLVGERHIEEVTLWKEFLVFATFYGIAGQVRADMKKVAPDVTRLEDMLRVLPDLAPLTTAITTSFVATRNFVTDKERREEEAKRRDSYSSSSYSASSYSSSSGGSGHSSYSGGGGHTGGGGSGFR